MQRTPPASLSDLIYPTQKLGAVTKKKNEIIELLGDSSGANRALVSRLYEELLEKITVFSSACSELIDSLDGDSKSRLLEWHQQHMASIVEFRIRVDKYLSVRDRETGIIPGSSALSVSSLRSQQSTTSSARVRLAERKAQQVSQKAYNAKLQLIEEEKLKLEEREMLLRKQKSIDEMNLRKMQREAEEEKLKIENETLANELDKIEANLLKVCDESLPATSSESDFAIRKPYKTVGNATPGDITTKDLITVIRQQNEISLSLKKSQDKSSLPAKEIIKFDGKDLTKFHLFLQTFKRAIENKCDDDADRLYYLEQYTAGPVRELVMSCSHSDASVAYISALELIEKEYGNEYAVSSAYIDKLNAWPTIKVEDGEALRNLSTFLLTCLNYMTSMDSLNQLNSPKEIMNIIQKLPYDMRKRWRDLTLKLTEEKKSVTFKELVAFVRRQAAVVNQPVFGKLSDSNTRKASSTNESACKKKIMTTKTDRAPKATLSEKSANLTSCACCKKENHRLEECKFLQHKTLQERKDFIKNQKLCYSCLQSGHLAKGCKSRLSCKVCKRQHPTVLHDNQRSSSALMPNVLNEAADEDEPRVEPAATLTNNATCVTGAGASKVFCPVVPVVIRLKGMKRSLLTYAALDSCSSSCFMNKDLFSKLGIRGTESKLTMTTMNDVTIVSTNVVHNVELYDLDYNLQDTIPVVYANESWPFTKRDVPNEQDITGLDYLASVPFNFVDVEIGLLIGMNRPEMLKTLSIVDGDRDLPFASLHRLGWALNGPSLNGASSFCHRIKISDVDLENKIVEMYSQDFKESHNSQADLSRNDHAWLEKVGKSVKRRPSGHYEVSLPLKENHQLPSNRNQVYSAFLSQKRRMQRDSKYYADYQTFMNMMLDAGFMEKVPEEELHVHTGGLWYLSHHGVYHKEKGKIRVVFNCSLKFRGQSLNDILLPGPDLANSLLGVLIRFRQGEIGILGDIAKMFYQVKVPKDQSNLLRFFWLRDNDLSDEPVEYRLTVHVFGAVSSPSVANFALRKVSEDHDMSDQCKAAINENFYVDDLLLSTNDASEAEILLRQVREALGKGGFHLTDIVSNDANVLKSVPAADVGNLEGEATLLNQHPQSAKALGIKWNLDQDTLGFKVNLTQNHITRRGILSTINSIYDPIGISGPAIIPGKVIFQETCRLKLDWDDPLPDDLADKWRRWSANLELLRGYEFPRAYASGKSVRREIHYFCDGSETAYGAIAYMRSVAQDGTVSIAPVLAKVRLTPLANTSLKTIPRIELNAARLSIILKQIIDRELKLPIDVEYFWTDSTTVLKYITNEELRLHRFVANRVSLIVSCSSKNQWRHVPQELNPADHISRGVSVTKFLSLDQWKTGPEFLRSSEQDWPVTNVGALPSSDPEVNQKVVSINCMTDVSVKPVLSQRDPVELLMNSSSNLNSLLCKVAWILRFKSYLKHKASTPIGSVTVHELASAELELIKLVQRQYFSSEMNSILKNQPLKKSNPLRKLYLFLDGGVLRVGGRLERSSEPLSFKHPVLLPKNSCVAELVVKREHCIVGHLGRETVLASLRRKYWIEGANSLIRKVVRCCMTCRKRLGVVSQQLMASLPKDRIQGDEPPFTNTGIDFFGPFHVVYGRKTVKRYGVIFTCLASRAMHLEIAHSLDTDSFLNSFRRFLARRGNVRRVRSDNGTNLTCGYKEMKKEIAKWNRLHIENWMRQKAIDWRFQPPAASHFGGAFESEIRSVRRILSSLMNEQPLKLNDEQLSTLLCEAESILNNRPLTPASNDPCDLDAITPNYLLLLNSQATFPPGLFNREDSYSNRRWRQVQYLADVFWSRWRKEYLPLLQKRQKWFKNQRPHEVGDLVLVVDQLLPRNMWCLGRISEVYPDEHGNVRSAKIKIAKYRDASPTRFGTVDLVRPIVKLILLRSVGDLM